MLEQVCIGDGESLSQGASATAITDTIRGHAFRIDLFYAALPREPAGICGGELVFGAHRMALSPDHARSLADKARTAIDNSVFGIVADIKPLHGMN